MLHFASHGIPLKREPGCNPGIDNATLCRIALVGNAAKVAFFYLSMIKNIGDKQ
jgi:hypothetical protein